MDHHCRLHSYTHSHAPTPNSFTSPDAELYLTIVVLGQRCLIQRGPFTIRLVQHRSAPNLAAVVASVGDLQWLIDLHSPVRRQSSTCFCFFLPGSPYYRYDVILTGAAPDLCRLERFLQAYSPYVDDGGKNRSACLELADVALTASSDRCSSAVNVSPGIDRWMPSIPDSPSAAAAGYHVLPTANSCAAILDVCKSSIQTARMVSAVVKLLTKSLEKGAIRADAHTVEFGATAPNDNCAATSPDSRSAGAASLPCAAGKGAELSAAAIASVEAVNKILRAVTTGMEQLEEGAYSAAEAADTNGVEERRCWTLNRKGVEVMVAMVRALMRMRSSSNISVDGEELSIRTATSRTSTRSAESTVGKRRHAERPPRPGGRPSSTAASSYGRLHNMGGMERMVVVRRRK